jgi:hypothetical protein
VTPNDLKQISTLLDSEFKKHNKLIMDFVDSQFSVYDEKLEAKLLRWKSEIIGAVDAMAKEIVDERDFRTITTQ